MNTTNQNNNVTAAPSVTIAPRARNSQPSTINSQLLFVVTLTTFKDTRSYPCRSLESATKLVERFIAGLSRHSRATADVTKPARPSTPEAETNPHQYDGPPRTAEQVAA